MDEYTQIKDKARALEKKILKPKTSLLHIVLFAFLTVLILTSTTFFILKPDLIGLFIGLGSHNTEKLNLTINESGTYTIGLMGVPDNATITSIRLSGNARENGTFSVYLKHNRKKLLIVDDKTARGGLFGITALAFGIPETQNRTQNNITEEPNQTTTNITLNDTINTSINQTLNITPNETINHTINITLNENTTTNITTNTGQNITANISLNITTNLTLNDTINTGQNITANITLNDTKNQTTEEKEIRFTDLCKETCSIILNKTTFNITIYVNGTKLTLDNISYTYKDNTGNKPPQLIKSIPDQQISNETTVNLSEYFIDDEPLNYTYEEATGLDIWITDDILHIRTNTNFSGEAFTYATASDGELSTTSNTFKILQTIQNSEETIQYPAEINKPVRWLKKIKTKPTDIGKSIIETELPKRSTVTGLKKEGKPKDKKKIKKKMPKGDKEIYEINEQINKSNETIEIEYETEAPKVYEEIISENRKRITVSSAFNYTNITTYTNITESPKESIKVYWIVDGKRLDISKMPELRLEYIDNNSNGQIDMLRWITPHLSNQTFEISITILNVQSYPTLGGYWTVRFNTTGTANLTITAINSTTYTETENDLNTTTDDLEITELKCGNTTLFNKTNATYDNNTYFILGNGSIINASQIFGNSYNETSFRYTDYNCDNLTGTWKVKVHTTGKHIQEFRFGNQTAYAYNNVAPSLTNVTLNSTGTNTTRDNLTAYANGVSDPDLGQSVYINYNWIRNGVSRSALNLPFTNHSYSGGSTSYDFSGHGNDATRVNFGSYPIFYTNTSCKYDGCYKFESSGNSYFRVLDDNSLYINNTFSIELWINNTGSTSNDQKNLLEQKKLVGLNQYDGYTLGYNATNDKIYFAIYNSSNPSALVSNNTLTQGTWGHIVATYKENTNTAKIYINGVLSGNKTFSNSIGNPNANLSIGKGFAGFIDEVRIYNYVLSQQQAEVNYNSGSPRYNITDSNKLTPAKYNVTGCPIDSLGLNGTCKTSNTVEVVYSNPPIQDTPILNSTYGTNKTTENLTVYNISTNDVDGDNVKNIITWYRNGSSIMALNMPFEGIWSFQVFAPGTTKVYDYSGYGNNGTVYGVTSNRTGGYDGRNAMNFNGASYINITGTENDLNTTEGTIELRVIFDEDISAPPGAFERDLIVFADNRTTMKNRILLTKSAQNELILNYTAEGTSYYSNISNLSKFNNSYVHIAAVWDKTNLSLYANAELYDTSAKGSDIIAANLTRSHIGTNRDASGNYFNGVMDELRVYRRALTPEQILALYNNMSNTLVSAETIKGDKWKACITPNDEYINGNESCSNNVTIKSATETNCTAGCLYIRNSTGGNVTIFDKLGNVDTTGTVYESSIGSPDGNDMIFRNSTGDTVAWIDDTTGNIRLFGTMSQQQGSYCTAPTGSFTVKDTSGNCVSYIDDTGNLWTKEQVVENAEIN